MFADDLKFAQRVEGPEDTTVIQETLSRLHHWCLLNCMELNVSKCSIITFHHIRSPILATYSISGQALARHERVRDLGVTFEKDLRFITHIQNIKSKASRMLGFISRNSKNFADVSTLKTLYYAYVKSVLEYCSVVWSPYYSVHIKSLESIQHKFLRSIAFRTNSPIRNHDYSEIETKYEVMTLGARRQLNDLVFLHKLINHNIFCPDLLYQINIHVPTRNTRSQTIFKLDRCKTNAQQHSSLQRCQNLWNKLASEGDVDVFSDPCSRIVDFAAKGGLPFALKTLQSALFFIILFYFYFYKLTDIKCPFLQWSYIISNIKRGTSIITKN
uniref:Reverse transcriptase domain-containing protein n=1 Tax=Cacopsylla melanoneura TaxID=428564 RepID=A0A8D9ESG1_9HEMI